jgi:hypothetical protein
LAVKLGQTCLHEVVPIGRHPAAATEAAVAVKLGQTCPHKVVPIGWRPAAAIGAAVAEPDKVHREAVGEPGEVDAGEVDGGRTWTAVKDSKAHGQCGESLLWPRVTN